MAVLPRTPSTSAGIAIFDKAILVIVHSCTHEIPKACRKRSLADLACFIARRSRSALRPSRRASSDGNADDLGYHASSDSRTRETGDFRRTRRAGERTASPSLFLTPQQTTIPRTIVRESISCAFPAAVRSYKLGAEPKKFVLGNRARLLQLVKLGDFVRRAVADHATQFIARLLGLLGTALGHSASLCDQVSEDA